MIYAPKPAPTSLRNCPKACSTHRDKKSVNEEVCTLSNVNRHVQDIQYTQLLDEVKSKVIHRVFMSELDQPEVNKTSSPRWLTDGRVQAKTKALIIPAQDGVVRTRDYIKNVKGAAGSNKCRISFLCAHGTGSLCTRNVTTQSFFRL